jgi:hypothetical protein
VGAIGVCVAREETARTEDAGLLGGAFVVCVKDSDDEQPDSIVKDCHQQMVVPGSISTATSHGRHFQQPHHTVTTFNSHITRPLAMLKSKENKKGTQIILMQTLQFGCFDVSHCDVSDEITNDRHYGLRSTKL